MCVGGLRLSPHGALRAYTVLLTAEPRRGSSLVLSLSATYGPHLPEVRVWSGGYPVTAWRTSCLYGVTYSRASPRLFLGAIFVCYIRTAPPPRCESVGWLRLSPHGALTCLYGVTYSRASPMLFPWCYLRLLHTDRTSPRCECRRWLSCHRMAHFVLIRCYLQPSLAEALPWCYLLQ